MQISIDTSRDSKEDIVKAIKLLESIIGESHLTVMPSRNIFESSQPEIQSQGSQQSVFGSFFDNVAKTDVAPVKKQSIPRVELY